MAVSLQQQQGGAPGPLSDLELAQQLQQEEYQQQQQQQGQQQQGAQQGPSQAAHQVRPREHSEAFNILFYSFHFFHFTFI